MIDYKRVAVASAFSPTFSAVLAEADRFARFWGAELEVLHASEPDAEKERRFQEELGRPVTIRWCQGESPALALSKVADDACDILVAGALAREDLEKPFTSGVARELLRIVTCDLLLVPAPTQEDRPVRHVVFLLEPGEKCEDYLLATARALQPVRVTIAVADTPFAAALAASRGEEPCDTHAWCSSLVDFLKRHDFEADSWIVTSNTGYSLYDAIQGLSADLLVIRAPMRQNQTELPAHLDWLYQIIPLRLLVIRGSSDAGGEE